MEDSQIIEMLTTRQEEGLRETEKKYGKSLYAVAHRLLNNREDSREAVSDALLGAWQSIPPNRPENLFCYLTKLVRRSCIDILRRNTRKKRGGGQAELSMEELSQCLPDHFSVEEQTEEREFSQRLGESINQYLCSLPETPRQVFVSRYFYADPIREIASNFHMSGDSVKSMLYRTRKGLKAFLEKEGFHP